ncbi:hypothetical protein [Actinacidiphila acididurans]|uniref:Uncharacterized protein n=1 Tax=Actinacidiphila acididurans TaxID=2784346 RepID=A0ABS2TUH0_9ACTN|nr:hypothetical protein [Actinacidiphila acididurans]MBM9506727.1 hypothetical protein [Actinacidiphila acididurans]
MDEPFGPEYVRPKQKDCPHCGCCTEDLCKRGRSRIVQCAGLTPDRFRDTVSGCPCSAETTRHTAAWQAARVRVTRLARERPLTAEAEVLLRSLWGVGLAEDVEDPGGPLPQLKVRGLVRAGDSRRLEITERGRTYLAARDEVRAATAVWVRCVDTSARTVLVEVSPWEPGEPVTVFLDQVVDDTGLPADKLTGRWQSGEANRHAESADALVLNGFRNSALLPAGWTGENGGEDE